MTPNSTSQELSRPETDALTLPSDQRSTSVINTAAPGQELPKEPGVPPNTSNKPTASNPGDADVISIPSSPAQREDDDSDLESDGSLSSSPDDDGQDKDDDEVDELGSRVASLMTNDRDEVNWKDACRYFYHNPILTTTKLKEGFKLTGAQQTLLPFQLTDVYNYICLVTNPDPDKRRYGAVFAHEMGLGKTRSCSCAPVLL
ncbi:hypothetical protein CGMCC3_g17831 [Colletotrichum fructicola]|nr:uncharacterized protein CGMCC3_g17831 [Colletotrichum fructicola]KAE9565989.1 hypothetical protein CGMCC3_g17831 [Colletotrichum fructicola]